MRKHRCPGGVKVARFPGMSEVSGSIPVSGLCFLLIFVVFTLCLLPSLLSACTVKRGAPSTVKVERSHGISEVSGSIPVSGLCFLLIFVVFTLCLLCYSSLLSACTVKRGAPSTV